MSANFIVSIFLIALSFSTNAFAADGQPWQIVRTSGQVWLEKPAVQPVALTSGGADLAPGDQITTGKNGRVLLVRGEERIEMAPGTSIALPKDSGPFPTTVTQRAGTITLDVEKKNVQHFEVSTPHMAAVVKGTQFSVTVSRDGTEAGVSRGQVQVSDFKTGQIGDILPGQAARVSLSGSPGIKLSGSGTFLPITQGTPRLPSAGTQAGKQNAPASGSVTDAGKGTLASAPDADKPAKANSDTKPRDPQTNKQKDAAHRFNHARNGNVRGQDAAQGDGSSTPMNVVSGTTGGGAAPAGNSGASQGSGPVVNNVGSSASGNGVSASGSRGGSNNASSGADTNNNAVTNNLSGTLAATANIANSGVGANRDDASTSQNGKGNSDKNSQGRNASGNWNGNGNGKGNGNGNGNGNDNDNDNINTVVLKGKKG